MKRGRKQKTKKNNPLLLEEAEKTLSLCLRKKKESFSFTRIIIIS
jgi:hypothetical protein